MFYSDLNLDRHIYQRGDMIIYKTNRIVIDAEYIQYFSRTPDEIKNILTNIGKDVVMESSISSVNIKTSSMSDNWTPTDDDLVADDWKLIKSLDDKSRK